MIPPYKRLHRNDFTFSIYNRLVYRKELVSLRKSNSEVSFHLFSIQVIPIQLIIVYFDFHIRRIFCCMHSRVSFFCQCMQVVSVLRVDRYADTSSFNGSCYASCAAFKGYQKRSLQGFLNINSNSIYILNVNIRNQNYKLISPKPSYHITPPSCILQSFRYLFQ